MSLELVQEIGKWGVATILSIGVLFVLYTAVSDKKENEVRWMENMERQTEALEELVRIYSGG